LEFASNPDLTPNTVLLPTRPPEGRGAYSLPLDFPHVVQVFCIRRTTTDLDGNEYAVWSGAPP